MANAARCACRLVEDVINYLVAEIQVKHITLIIESQSMQHALEARRTGRAKIVPDDIRRLSQVTGCLMGAFSNMSNTITLIQPKQWKGDLPKDICHRRTYRDLNIQTGAGVKNAFPENMVELSKWSKDTINAGDFADINDSLGLALWGASQRV